MNARVAVLGATGVYGRHLLPRLIAAGYRVRALVRKPEGANLTAVCGAELAAADIFDGASLRAGLSGCDVAINLATSLPAPGEQGDFAKNDQLRREGTPIFVRACREAGVSRILQQSIAMTHAGGGDAWADEDTFHPVGEGIAGAAIAAVRDMEAAVVASDLDWLILRGGLFYGPAPVSTTTGSRAPAPASCGCPQRAMTMSRSCTSPTWPMRRSPRFADGRRARP